MSAPLAMAKRHGGGGAFQALVDGEIQDVPDDALARAADKQRAGKVAQLAQPAQHLQALLRPPAEAEAGVQDQALGRDAGLLGDGAARQEATAECRR